jgi:hypothetical protein
MGELYGHASPVIARKDYQQFEWYGGDIGSEVGHKLAAASNGFYACNGTINGEEAILLEWGVYNSSTMTPPDGCWNTRVTTRVWASLS